jgi:protein SCO1/2
MAFTTLKKWFVLVAILALPGVIYFYVTKAENHFMPLAIIGVEGHQIPIFSFINQNSDTISNANYEGNIYVANFFFTTCPTICPIMTNKMKYVQDKLSVYPNIKFLSHTVDPENDSPEKLLEYAQSMQADLSNWNFVTGERQEIYKIAASYFVNVSKDELAPGGFLHSEYFVLIDKERKVRSGIDINGNPYGAYDGTNDKDIKTLIKDIRVLMAEYKQKENQDENQ